jgi:hypothetical protein
MGRHIVIIFHKEDYAPHPQTHVDDSKRDLSWVWNTGSIHCPKEEHFKLLGNLGKDPLLQPSTLKHTGFINWCPVKQETGNFNDDARDGHVQQEIRMGEPDQDVLISPDWVMGWRTQCADTTIIHTVIRLGQAYLQLLANTGRWPFECSTVTPMDSSSSSVANSAGSPAGSSAGVSTFTSSSTTAFI